MRVVSSLELTTSARCVTEVRLSASALEARAIGNGDLVPAGELANYVEVVAHAMQLVAVTMGIGRLGFLVMLAWYWVY